jgi:hypothetical protein
MRHDIPTEKQQEEEEEQEEEQKGEQEEGGRAAGAGTHAVRAVSAWRATTDGACICAAPGLLFVPASIKAADHILMKENLFAVLWSCVHRCCRPVLRKENLFAAGFNIVLV